MLIDEQASPGGQIYRGIERSRPNSPLGPAYSAGRSLAAALRASRAEYRAGTTLWHIDPDGTLYVESGGRTETLNARRVLLATGALERPVPIPGWTLPGVMGAGAAQILLKSGDLVPEGRAVLAGQGRSSISSRPNWRAPEHRRLLCSRRRHWRITSRPRDASTPYGRAAAH